MVAPAPLEPESRAPRSSRHPGWPLTALLMLYPVWWALGMGTLIVFVLAVPMVVQLVRRGRVAVPPGFVLWLGFLLCMLASTALLGLDPPGTLPESIGHRLTPFVFNGVSYLAVTVVLLYIGNLTEAEFPRRKLVRQLAFFFTVVVAGGLLGVVAPGFQFTSPVERVLPSSFTQSLFVKSLVHPASSQIQGVLGYLAPRPAAPFGYTNMWGNCLALLLGFFAISWLRRGQGWRRPAGIVILVLAMIPVVYSLNRGLWVGLGLALGFVLVRLAVRGHVAAVVTMIVAAVAVGALLVATPLSTLVSERLANPDSNNIRSFTTVKTIETLQHSPVLGFGAGRALLGSSNSIVVGKTSACPRCGNASLGINGQLWAVLIGQGYLGGLLYVGFFLRSMWAYRRDRTPIGDAGLLAIFLSLWFMFVYNALVMPLLITMMAIGLLWRQQRLEGTASAARPATTAAPALRGLPLRPVP